MKAWKKVRVKKIDKNEKKEGTLKERNVKKEKKRR